MDFVFLRFIDAVFEWMTTGRFPREEFRVRTAVLRGLAATLAALAVLTILAWLLVTERP